MEFLISAAVPAKYRLLRAAILLAMPVFFSGCVSSMIVSAGGKRYEDLLKSSTDVRRVHQVLGSPIWRTEYKPPLAIRSTPEYMRAQRNVSISTAADRSDKTRVAICEVYEIKGPLHDTSRGQVYMMAAGCTFGALEVLDPIFIPISIAQTFSKERSYLTFWYDQQGKYVGSYVGDIRGGKGVEPAHAAGAAKSLR